MKKNITSLIVFIIPILISTNSFSQDWFSINSYGEKINGFVVGIAGDTLPGYIQYDYPIVMQKKVTMFLSLSSTEVSTYGPGDIRSYHINGKNWISSEVTMDTYNGLFKFSRFGLMISQNGPILLIRFYDEMDKHKKNINSEEADLIMDKIPLDQTIGSLEYLYISKDNASAEKVDTKTFKKDFINKMKSYVGDNVILFEKINNKEYSIQNIHQIVEDYNSWYNNKIRNK